MRPLNRPMFKYGGPIKEGIMQGMKDGGSLSPQFNTGLVGDERYPKTGGRENHAFFLAPLVGQGIMAAGRFLAPRAIAAGAKAFGRGFMTSPGKTGVFDKGLTGMQRLRNILPTGRFLQPATPTGQKIAGKYVPAPLRFSEAIRSPEVIGRAVRENPIAAFGVAGQVKNIPDIVSGGAGLAADAGLGAVNYLLGTDFKRGEKGDDLKTTDGTGIKRGEGKVTNVGSTDTGGTGDSKSDAEKKQINEARIEENKQKYYKLMGIDKMNKEATYDSLIDASKIIAEKGGDLKGSIKDGSLQSSLISAISKNLDKSTDLKKQIDAAVLKAEITKDINLTKPSAFAEQVAYLRNNPNDPLARKLSGLTSVADNLAALADKPITSDIVSRLVQSKGTDVAGIIKDDKYQKWEKNNENKDEIDYLQDVFKGKKLEEGVYIINKKAISIDENGNAFPVDLDSIIG